MSDFLRTMQGKFILFLLATLFLCALILSSIAAVTMAVYGFYTDTEHSVYRNLASGNLRFVGRDAVKEAVNPEGVSKISDWNTDSNLLLRVTRRGGEVIFETDTLPENDEWEYHYSYGVWRANGVVEFIAPLEPGKTVKEAMKDAFYVPETTESGTEEYYDLLVSIKPDLPVNDWYAFLSRLVYYGYSARVIVLTLVPLFFVLSAASLVALLTVAGRRPKTDGLFPGPLHRTPYDLLILAVAGFAVAMFYIGSYISYLSYNGGLAVLIGSVFAGVLFFLALALSAAVRAKDGSFLRNTLLYRLGILIGKAFRRLRQNASGMAATLPAYWPVFLIFLIILIVKAVFFVLDFTLNKPLLLYIGWIGTDIFAGILVFIAAFYFSKLERSGKELSEGNLDYQTDTTGMPQPFRRHAENLNSLAKTTQRAVDEQLRSERSKTDLITNVSHDIKTPLTSIINYATLIGQNPSTDPGIREYSEVLVRQSVRLKHLIEDLVEVSRAQAGNLEVHPEPCDASVLVEQMSGEYAERLQSAGLTLVTRLPDEPVRVLVDGRRMWRVFDNLMGNICKYAMPGSRVFVDVDVSEDRVHIRFKNTSKDQLDMPAGELMERFVRADKTRNSEGSGLGIPIAKSMTEIQGGRFLLEVDGDLFKITLDFPLFKGGESPSSEAAKE